MTSLTSKCHSRGCKHTLIEHRVAGTSSRDMTFPCTMGNCRCQDFAEPRWLLATDVIISMARAARSKDFWRWWARKLPMALAWYLVCCVPSAVASVLLQNYAGLPGWVGVIVQLAGMIFMDHKVWPPIRRKIDYLIKYRKEYLEDLDLR